MQPGSGQRRSDSFLPCRTPCWLAEAFFLAALLLTAASASAQINGGNCVRFNGTNGYASVPHDAALNAYPLSITAWVRTSRVVPLYEAIFNKYNFSVSINGYSLHIYDGRLSGFYFGTSGYVFATNPGFDGGFIADGHWHHVAMVIGPNGGVIYIDGESRGTPLGWTGTPSAPTTVQPVSVGQYPGFSNVAGDIDDVAVWNRALSANEVNYLKHRKLTGTEDGLLSLWRFDETGGTTSADATAAARTATLNGPVARPASAAPIALNMVATNCLRFDGVNGYVSVPHNTNFNAYPFTAMGWFRTANTASPLVQGIVTKYQDSSGNGWALIVQNNQLRGFYYRTLSNYGMDLASAVNVTDGSWHHAAMVVDTNGGKLFLDGVQIASGGWVGAAGPPTGVEPLQIGHYYNYAERFFGTLDEISIWNRGLTGSEINDLKNRPLAGNEANLLAYWRMNEGADTSVADATGHGHHGSFIGPIAWKGSDALLGDGSVHLRGAANVPAAQRFFAITGAAPGANAFAVSDTATLWRFYDYGPVPPSSTVSVRLDAGLQIAGAGTPLAVKSNAYVSTFGYNSYNASTPSAYATFNRSFNVEPQHGVQLDSVNNLHQMTVTFSHNENGGDYFTNAVETTPPARLLHFNGHLMFDGIDTIVTNVVNPPTSGAVSAPTHLAAQLPLNFCHAYLAGAPAMTFPGGFGAMFNVHLDANGFATNLSPGPFSFCNSSQFFETNGIRYQFPDATLGTNGLVAPNFLAWFPTGFGMSIATNIRVMKPFIRATNVVLGPNLAPTNSTIVFTAASYNTNRLYFAEETKPVIFGASQIEWRIQQGEFYIPPPESLQYVRKFEDDYLESLRTNLVDQLAADRISNDGYYRNTSIFAGAPVYIRPDTNGAALLDMTIAVFNSEYRPHFPYLSRPTGGHITALGGTLEIDEDLINVNGSYLVISNPAPLVYARDCGPETACSSFATTGPAVLPFTLPTTFSFTRDGGLLGFGTVPATNLTWGFTGGTNFAQRTSNVQTGAYHIAGTFLRGDQTALPDFQRPAVILFTGWGDETDVLSNSSYVERPGTSNYANGFANYSGLNFRAPAQGRSFIAGQDTGWYPLTSRSKYYLRYGGVSGIHEAASFPTSLALYGYPFTFQTYCLSFLDSDNWESRTDGAVALPYPSGFNVEFERLKFRCRGSLDAARLPPTIGTKHLAYWNADLKPLSLQFKPRSDNACSLTERYLVLGVETKLPFLPQALHAALAFQANGNLATKATAVEGVDSRFPVPANLQLRGPGGSHYPFTTAGWGYFNNWETPGRPAAGFYNLIGRIRVPFFQDLKAQLHVTPTGPNTSQIAIAGGWPAASGLGQDRGWNVGGQNYFNTAGFDATHNGWPAGVTLDEYRNSPDENYRPRAQQNWIDVAIFDYPLAWNGVLREFAGFTDARVVLPVIDVDSRLKQLTPGKVDFDFAQDINLQLPRLKLLDLANDALNEVNAPINTLSNAIRQELGALFNTSGLTSGFRSLQTALRENADDFFRPVLQPALDPVVDSLYVPLANALAVGKDHLLTNTAAIIAASSNGLQTALMNLNGTTGQVSSVFGQLNQTLTDVDNTLGLFIRVLEKDGGGNRHVVRAIIQKLAQDQGPALGLVANLGDTVVNGLLTDLEPTLAKIEGELVQLRSQFDELRTQMAAATGDFSTALNAANHDGDTLQAYLQQAGGAVSNLLNAVVGPAEDFFTADPERAKREIRERLVLAFLGSSLSQDYQTTFRQFLSDKNFLLDQLMDVLFDQINRSIRNGLSSQIAGAQDGVFQNLKGAGLLSQSLLSAKIRGAPTFEGDSLRKIHLDAEIKMNLPDEMKFTAFMDIKHLRSQSTPISCIPAGAPAAEVTLGARDVRLDWAGVSSGGTPLRMDLEARWTLQSGAVLGIGGALDIKGKAGFKGCSMNNIGAALAIGRTENYFAGKAAATVLILGVPVNFNAGMFAGKACSITPLVFVDPEAQQVLNDPLGFSGVYLNFGGGLSLSEILLGTSSCVLDVRAAIQTAVYYQGGPRFGIIGGRQKTSVDVDLLCVLSGHADWAVFIVLDTSGQLTVGGSAQVCGEIGVCPVCAEGCKSVSIKGVVNDGGIDYFIDY